MVPKRPCEDSEKASIPPNKDRRRRWVWNPPCNRRWALQGGQAKKHVYCVVGYTCLPLRRNTPAIFLGPSSPERYHPGSFGWLLLCLFSFWKYCSPQSGQPLPPTVRTWFSANNSRVLSVPFSLLLGTHKIDAFSTSKE